MVRHFVLGTTLLLIASCSRETVISVPTPTIAVLPDALDLGEAVAADQLGGSPARRSTTAELFVENIGRSDLRWAIALDDDDFAIVDAETGDVVSSIEGELEPGDDQRVQVRFAPTVLGDAAATLVVTSNDPDRPAIDVPLTGVGRIPFAPDIEILPRSVDFGTVDLGGTGSQILTIFNRGDAPLVLGTLSQAGAGTFTLDRDPSGTELLPGANLAVLLEYEALQPGGDSGTLTVRSNDADEPAIDVPLEANGGGDFEYPVAVITGCPATADTSQPVLVELSGASSTDPDGGALEYRWSIPRRPTAGDPGNEPTPDDEVETTFAVDAAGFWEATLVVTNQADLSSVPAKCVIDATPIDDVYVELSWAGPTSDLDLHLAREGAAFFDVPGDVSYCNRSPDWGTPGDSSDDPSLARDDDDGLGPEVITLPLAVDESYLVRVHHFDDGDDDAVTATVVAYANGERITQQSQVLARNQVWDVGQINWPDATFGTSNAPVYDAGGTRECTP